METVSVRGGDEKVYGVSSKNYLKVFASYAVWSVPPCLAFMALYIFFVVLPKLQEGAFVFQDSGILDLIIFTFVVFIMATIVFLITKTYAKNSYLHFQNVKDNSIRVFVYLSASGFDTSNYINSINTIKRKRYGIVVYGAITQQYQQGYFLKISYTTNIPRFRIPAYFEDMDEIYAALERMKGQAGD